MHDEHGRHLMTQFSGFATAMSSDQERGLGKEIGSQELVALADARSAFKL